MTLIVWLMWGVVETWAFTTGFEDCARHRERLRVEKSGHEIVCWWLHGTALPEAGEPLPRPGEPA